VEAGVVLEHERITEQFFVTIPDHHSDHGLDGLDREKQGLGRKKSTIP
jgi:hypothetical protein